MTTALNWTTEFYRRNQEAFHNRLPIPQEGSLLEDLIKEAQLDAMKEGAFRAAEIANSLEIQAENIFQTIITTSKNWTIKDL